MAIALKKVNREQSRALMRLTLRVMGEGQRIFNEFGDWLINLVKGEVDGDGMVNGGAVMQLMPQVETKWRGAIEAWVRLFENGRTQAASLPFGVLAVQHNAYLPAAFEETMTRVQLDAVVALWMQRRQRALEATRTRVLGDGLNLSQRIWRLEHDGLATIRNTLLTAMDGRTNAVDLARLLESELGVNQDLPRWTLSRLYRMTPSERAADRRGLLRDPQDRARGISYNALRLARTELQFANHAVNTEIARHAPWITGRKVRLSPGHPRVDICDSYAAGGPYEKDLEILPLHPNCVTPGQMVKTKVGDKQIEAMCAGDEVLTHTGEYKRVNLYWTSTYEGNVYRIETGLGSFELTSEHPVLTGRGWVEAQQIGTSDCVLSVGEGYGWVTNVIQRWYSGPVYNMSVEEDESYTVNGAAVHNCMCYYEDVLMPADEFTRDVREWLNGGNTFLDDYQDWMGMQAMGEPLTANMPLVEVLEFWLSVSSDGHGAALGVR